MKYSADTHIPGFSIDCVLFSFHDQQLQVLLLKLKSLDLYALPGGFLRKDEETDEAAMRILGERTGLSDIYLHQFHLFSSVNRHDNGHVDKMLEKKVIREEDRSWFDQRFITLGYYALVNYTRIDRLHADFASESCDWHPLSEAPELMLDHSDILRRAHRTLKEHLNSYPVGQNLLPEEFTMPELQALYEAILGRPLDRRNFQRKMLGLGVLERRGKRKTGEAHKAPWQYSFEPIAYARALEEGLAKGF